MRDSEWKNYLDDCLNRRVIFFTGKGGVGKTTLAWTTAVACQRAGKRVSVASWSPYGEEADSLPIYPGVRTVPLNTLSAFKEYTLKVVRFEKVYDVIFDNPVLKTFILATPGLSETVIAGKIWDLWDEGEQDLLIVDMPSSGHAISFFKSPLGVRQVFHVGLVNRNTEKIIDMFRHPSVRMDLISLPEELPMTECSELKGELARLHPMNFGFLHINRCLPDFGSVKGEGAYEAFANSYETRLTKQKLHISEASHFDMQICPWELVPSVGQMETVAALSQPTEGAK